MITRRGGAAGTIASMSPEQLPNEDLDGRSDLFAVGCVLYEMVSGTQRFGGATMADAIAAILTTREVTMPASVPADLARIIRRCLELPQSKSSSPAIAPALSADPLSPMPRAVLAQAHVTRGARRGAARADGSRHAARPHRPRTRSFHFVAGDFDRAAAEYDVVIDSRYPVAACYLTRLSLTKAIRDSPPGLRLRRRMRLVR